VFGFQVQLMALASKEQLNLDHAGSAWEVFGEKSHHDGLQLSLFHAGRGFDWPYESPLTESGPTVKLPLSISAAPVSNGPASEAQTHIQADPNPVNSTTSYNSRHSVWFPFHHNR
jgi:hypothetical protein